MDYEILDKISAPSDIKKLNNMELHKLCGEIRECIINTVSKNGGHLASNLGTVELTVALHRAFDSPKDALVFDVGHQCYTHKLLTGRFKQFSSLRTENGISGFMKPSESIHDSVITGHSSNSISVAYGIYCSKKLSGEDGTAVAIIGDGAMTGGMAYEALNNIGNKKGNFIVVLNDNKMSISNNVGALSRSLTKMRNKPKYHHFKFALSRFLLKIPLIGKSLNSFVFKFKEVIKGFIYKNNFFSALGLNYLGPVNGHDVEGLESLFNIAKSYDKPSIVHVITVKGKGYSYAEDSPKNYHGVSPFDIEEGATLDGKCSFSSVAGDTLCELAKENSKICAVTAAMTGGTGLSKFAENYPERFFDVGIAEEHAVTFCAGLCIGGMKPFFAVYSSFLQRGFDQIIHDCAIGKIPVCFLVDRAGIVGEDGETHQGLFDISFLSCIPNIEIYSPSSYKELKYCIEVAASSDKITVIRYPRGCESSSSFAYDYKSDFTVIGKDSNRALITYGRLFENALEAYDDGSFDIVKLNKIFPINDNLLNKIKKYENIHIFEETVKSGGIGEHIVTALSECGYNRNIKIHCINNNFVPASTVQSALIKNGLDTESMRSI